MLLEKNYLGNWGRKYNKEDDSVPNANIVSGKVSLTR
jgi:hypothetical protein